MAIDREKLIDRIRTIDGLTDDERSALMGLLRERKTYGLVWEDKPEDVEERLRTELPILREVKDRAIISDNADAPNHILIEGDNLEALTTLAYTHEGKIDVIYIDPPYNTGNKDFVYNDSFVDREDGYRHSKWLSFMAKRLRIAKRLLSEKGVIFISIDDNEQAQLKLLCDEIFGEQNFLSDTIRISTKRIKGDAKDINIIHDYLLTYRKSDKFEVNHKIREDYSIYELEDEFVESRGRHLIRPLDNGNIGYSSSLDYEIEAPDGSIIVAGGDHQAHSNRLRGNHGSKDWCFRWSKEKFLWGVENGLIIFKQSKGQWRCYFKIYQFVDNNLNPTDKFENYTSFLDGFYNNQGTSEIKKILGTNSGFNYPKPLGLLKEILPMHRNKKMIILDFFAGSGTTLHATMQLNAEDGGKRQCILVTNNENGICENVTYERNKRVIQGYTTPKGVEVDGLTDNNLRYYRTDFVGRSRSMRNMHRLVNLATDMLCIKENLYTEQTEMAGMKTHPQIFRFFDDGRKQMLIIYREEYISEIVDLIDTMDVKQPMKVYVFSPSDDPATELFEDVADKVELTALPAAIYNTYKRILPKRRNQRIDGEEDALKSAEDETESLGGLFAKGGDQ